MWRRSAENGFAKITADLGLVGLDVRNGQVWAAGSGGVVTSPSYAPRPVSAAGNGVFFDGLAAFVVERGGQVEAYSAEGSLLGSSPASTGALLAITGVLASLPGDAPQPRLTWEGGAAVRLAPGASTTIALGFEDPCGATPADCVQICARSSRCSSGVICTSAKKDALVNGHVTLGVRYSAAPSPGLEELELLIAPMSWDGKGFGGSVRVPIALEPIPAKVTPQTGGGGGTGGGSSSGGGGGSSSCGHCVSGQSCSACGSGTSCGGKTCCSPGETCSGTTCRTSATSGHSGTTVQQCGATARYTVQCGGGGCCPTCMTCNSDGTCNLP